MDEKRKIPFLLWPLWALFQLVFWILKLTGRLVGAILGLVIVLVGVVLSITVIGAVIGVPLVLLGLMLMIKAVLGWWSYFSKEGVIPWRFHRRGGNLVKGGWSWGLHFSEFNAVLLELETEHLTSWPIKALCCFDVGAKPIFPKAMRSGITVRSLPLGYRKRDVTVRCPPVLTWNRGLNWDWLPFWKPVSSNHN